MRGTPERHLQLNLMEQLLPIKSQSILRSRYPDIPISRYPDLLTVPVQWNAMAHPAVPPSAAVECKSKIADSSICCEMVSYMCSSVPPLLPLPPSDASSQWP